VNNRSQSSPEQKQEEEPFAMTNEPEPRQAEDLLVELNKPTSPTDKDLMSLFTIGSWAPFEPRQPLPYNPLHLTPLLVNDPFFLFLPLPPVLEMATVDVTMNDNDSKIREAKSNPPKSFDGNSDVQGPAWLKSPGLGSA
jgi:hypothetical protein